MTHLTVLCPPVEMLGLIVMALFRQVLGADGWTHFSNGAPTDTAAVISRLGTTPLARGQSLTVVVAAETEAGIGATSEQQVWHDRWGTQRSCHCVVHVRRLRVLRVSQILSTSKAVTPPSAPGVSVAWVSSSAFKLVVTDPIDMGGSLNVDNIVTMRKQGGREKIVDAAVLNPGSITIRNLRASTRYDVRVRV